MGLLDDILEAAKRQYAEGAPYREAVGGLLSADVQPMRQLLSRKTFVSPMTPKEGLELALNYSPMGLGMVKPKIPFDYIRNTKSAPQLGDVYGQKIEPAGRYLSEDTVAATRSDRAYVPPGFETGQHTFQNPMMIEWGGGYGTPTNWKNVLQQKYGGKTGKQLSKAIAKDGYDGIVTTDKYGTSEIVDLSMFLK